MREIKFRAWDRKAKAMFPIHEMKFGKMDNCLDSIGGVDIHHKDSDFEGDVWYGGHVSKMTGNPLQPKFELMQYTGLKDRNGKEIYEGDILTCEHYPFQDDGKYNYHGVIEWIEELSAFYMTKRLANPDKRGISDGISEPIEYIGEFEVIGNIYEHPELVITCTPK